MQEYNGLLKLVLDNLRKIFYPEEWIGIDLSLSKSEIFTLLLVEQNGEIIMSHIADYVNVPMSTATGIVDRLVKGDYLKRERSESDRRVVVIRLSDKGKKLIEELKEIIFKYISRVNEALTDEERQVIFKLFTKVMNVLNIDDEDNTSETAKEKVKRIEIE